MNRTRAQRSHVLPLLLAALVFRVLVPPGFMPGGGDMMLRASMCTTTPGRTETIELPAEPAQVHCDQCMAPPLGAPLAQVQIDRPSRATLPVQMPVAAQIADSSLVRAQSARAPPLA